MLYFQIIFKIRKYDIKKVSTEIKKFYQTYETFVEGGGGCLMGNFLIQNEQT